MFWLLLAAFCFVFVFTACGLWLCAGDCLVCFCWFEFGVGLNLVLVCCIMVGFCFVLCFLDLFDLLFCLFAFV